MSVVPIFQAVRMLMTSGEFGDLIAAETEKWGKVI
jgi:hypothetical protein